MPDFFLVSGLFLARVIDRDWRAYADRRVVHFAYFYLLWLVIQSALKFGQVVGRHDRRASSSTSRCRWSSPIDPVVRLYPRGLLGGDEAPARRQAGPAPRRSRRSSRSCRSQTGWILFDEFCAPLRLFPRRLHPGAGASSRLADWAARHVRRWPSRGSPSGPSSTAFFALTPSGLAGYPTLASLPVVEPRARRRRRHGDRDDRRAPDAERRPPAPFRYAGRHSIAIYLAFFLPMAATRAALVRFGVIDDVGVAALVVTAVAVVAPLLLERLVRHTPAAFLFRRPEAFGIAPGKPLTVQAA